MGITVRKKKKKKIGGAIARKGLSNTFSRLLC
jgi:hypothetical protein